MSRRRWTTKVERPLYAGLNGHDVEPPLLGDALDKIVDPFEKAKQAFSSRFKADAKEPEKPRPVDPSMIPAPPPQMADAGLSRREQPRKRPGVLWVSTPAGKQRFVYQVYSQALWGIDTHYTPKGTVLCYEDRSRCIGGHKELNLRSKFFLHCFCETERKVCFAQLTNGAADDLDEQVKKGVSLRGMTIELVRSEKDNGRLNCKVLDFGTREKADKLPPELDPLLSIYNLLKIDPVDAAVSKHLACGSPD